MAQLVKCLTLDFSLGHDLIVCGFQSTVEFLFGILSLPLSLPLPHLHSLSLPLKTNKQTNKKTKTGLPETILCHRMHNNNITSSLTPSLLSKLLPVLNLFAIKNLLIQAEPVKMSCFPGFTNISFSRIINIV